VRLRGVVDHIGACGHGASPVGFRGLRRCRMYGHTGSYVMPTVP
jgi:hypothetical protein